MIRMPGTASKASVTMESTDVATGLRQMVQTWMAAQVAINDASAMLARVRRDQARKINSPQSKMLNGPVNPKSKAAIPSCTNCHQWLASAEIRRSTRAPAMNHWRLSTLSRTS